MQPLKLHSLLVLGFYIISIIIRVLTYDFWSTEKHWIYLTGDMLSGLISIAVLVLMIINGIRLIRTAALTKKEKGIWLFINVSPLVFILIMSHLDI